MCTAYFQSIWSFPVHGALSLQDTIITSIDWLEKLECYFSHYSQTFCITHMQSLSRAFFLPDPWVLSLVWEKSEVYSLFCIFLNLEIKLHFVSFNVLQKWSPFVCLWVSINSIKKSILKAVFPGKKKLLTWTLYIYKFCFAYVQHLFS